MNSPLKPDGDIRNEDNKRRPYCKPLVERIELVLEESVLHVCKTGGSNSPYGNNCSPGQGCQRQSPS